MHSSEFDFDVITGPSIPEAQPAEPDTPQADDATPSSAASIEPIRQTR
jgi:hypothetical protein